MKRRFVKLGRTRAVRLDCTAQALWRRVRNRGGDFRIWPEAFCWRSRGGVLIGGWETSDRDGVFCVVYRAADERRRENRNGAKGVMPDGPEVVTN